MALATSLCPGGKTAGLGAGDAHAGLKRKHDLDKATPKALFSAALRAAPQFQSFWGVRPLRPDRKQEGPKRESSCAAKGYMLVAIPKQVYNHPTATLQQ